MRCSISTLAALSMIAAWLAGCGDDDGGARDAGRPDSGRDRCQTEDPEEAADLLGCNGGIIGPVPPNEYGGTCQARIEDPEDERGTCDEGLVCYRSMTSTRGLCLMACPEPPQARFYQATGGCSDGSRCFSLGGAVPLCFPDCVVGGDCSTGFCDPDHSCAVGTARPDAGPGVDAGEADGGARDGGELDAASEDAGASDAGGEIDAGATDGAARDGATPDAGPRDSGPADAAPLDAAPRDASDGSSDAASDSASRSDA